MSGGVEGGEGLNVAFWLGLVGAVWVGCEKWGIEVLKIFVSGAVSTCSWRSSSIDNGGWGLLCPVKQTV